MRLTNVKLSKLLYNGYLCLKDIEKEIYSDIDSEKFTINFNNNNFVQGIKYNFFTILMLSILIHSDIERKRIISYGKIIIYLRQIITSTDNIIDRENKGIIFCNTIKDLYTKNIFVTIYIQDLLTKECNKLNLNGAEILFQEIFKIAESEALRDINLYDEYPSPKYILDKIHSGIGGKLLSISLLLPSKIEKDIKLKNYMEGLYEIGLSLQGIDDYCDVEEDILNGKVNLFNRENKEQLFKETIEKAYIGFDIFEKNGYPIDRKSGKKLLNQLFKIRGIKMGE